MEDGGINGKESDALAFAAGVHNNRTLIYFKISKFQKLEELQHTFSHITLWTLSPCGHSPRTEGKQIEPTNKLRS